MLVALAVVGSALVFSGASAAPPEPDAADKIKPELAQQLENKGEATFWVRFDQADLSAASKIKRLGRARPGRVRRAERSRRIGARKGPASSSTART